MNNKIINTKLLILTVLIVASICLLGLGGYYLYIQKKYINEGDEVHAYVENILNHPDSNSETYEQEYLDYQNLLRKYRNLGIIDEHTSVAIIISYIHNGETYTTELGYFSDEYKISQIVTIYVNPKDSTDFVVEGKNNFAVYFCLIIGSLLLIGSCLVLFIERNNNKWKQYILNNGRIVEAEVLYVDENENKSAFNRHPYIFTCIYKDDNEKEIIYTSDSVYVKQQGINYIGKKVNVYVDPESPDNYYVDTRKFEKE